MKITAPILLVALAAALSHPAPVAAGEGNPPAPAAAAPAPAAAARAVSALNGVRARHGLSALRRSARLDRAARAQADWMARTGRIGHRGAGGSSPLNRVRAVGYGACYAAENVALGPAGGEAAVRLWLASARHRRNALSRRAGEVGAAALRDARGRPVWVMVFGAPCA